MLEKHGRLVLAVIIGVTIPWLITFIFMFSIGLYSSLSQAVDGNPLTLFTMIVFYSFNLTFAIPFLGNGFWLCFVSWAVPAIFIGLITRNLKSSLIAATLAILINFLLYLILIFYFSLPVEFIDPLINPSLYLQFSWQTPFLLLSHLAFTSFVLPILYFFTIFGGFMRDRLRVYPIDQQESDLPI